MAYDANILEQRIKSPRLMGVTMADPDAIPWLLQPEAYAGVIVRKLAAEHGWTDADAQHQLALRQAVGQRVMKHSGLRGTIYVTDRSLYTEVGDPETTLAGVQVVRDRLVAERFGTLPAGNSLSVRVLPMDDPDIRLDAGFVITDHPDDGASLPEIVHSLDGRVTHMPDTDFAVHAIDLHEQFEDVALSTMGSLAVAEDYLRVWHHQATQPDPPLPSEI